MSLTKKQEEGLRIIRERYENKEPYVTIAGYAGTGKTFLVRKAMEMLGLDSTEYRMATFTGKAALVLRQRGFNAVTLHKLLYKSIPMDSKGEVFIHTPKKFREDMEGVKVLVIDEISMVPNNILKQAAKHKIFIIALGDPFQLPPIGEDNGLLRAPNVFLDEIVRQEEGNSIIELSQKIRNYDGRPIEAFSDENVQIISQEEMVDGMFHWADQVICSKNSTRRHINEFMRAQKGFMEPVPEVGDKIIFTKNNWDRMNEEGFAIVNGMIAEVKNIEYGPKSKRKYGSMVADLETDFAESGFHGVPLDSGTFINGTPSDTLDTLGRPGKIEFADFGYAITVHKSQGSEFKKVLLLEEKLNKSIDLRSLYTGVTRAEEKLVLITTSFGSKFKP